jgi:outer membrane lipoprotein-sorting protein
MRHRLVACGVAVLAVAGPARAETTTACTAMREMEQAIEGFQDEEQVTSMQYLEGGRLVKTFEIQVVTKGAHKALVTFTAPGSMEGTRILVLDAETVYAYLPEFRRVRRIAAHALRHPFMGTNIYYEDISERWYSARWSCSPQKTADGSLVAELLPRPGVVTAYSKLRVAVGRRPYQIERLEYFEAGRHVRTQIRERWQKVGDQERPGLIRYASQDREAELRMEFKQWRVNTGVSDAVFTTRNLLRGQ